MREKRFHRLGVIQPTADATPIRRANDHGHRPLAVRAVAHLRRLVHNLIESRVDEIRELNLTDGAHAVEGRPYTDAGNGQFGQGRVHYSLSAVLLEQALSRTEDPPSWAHILAHNEHSLIARQLLVHRLAQGFDQGHLSHREHPPRIPGRTPHPHPGSRRPPRT